MTDSQLVVIGGRSGVGKSSVAFAMHDLLAERSVQHAVIEGDALDLAYPVPWEHGLAERNLAAIWANYRELGYRRLIYTNTVSVLEAEKLAEAMGDTPEVTSVLLRASDEVTEGRLEQRESGESLQIHRERSKRASGMLDREAPGDTWRIDTDGLDVVQVARLVLKRLGWLP